MQWVLNNLLQEGGTLNSAEPPPPTHTPPTHPKLMQWGPKSPEGGGGAHISQQTEQTDQGRKKDRGPRTLSLLSTTLPYLNPFHLPSLPTADPAAQKLLRAVHGQGRAGRGWGAGQGHGDRGGRGGGHEAAQKGVRLRQQRGQARGHAAGEEEVLVGRAAPRQVGQQQKAVMGHQLRERCP